jgi:enoyl-CoA hydratase
MTYTAQFIDAERALSYGFISQVVNADKLNSEVEQFCQILLSRPRPAIIGLKEYLHVAPNMDELGAIDYARALHSMVNTASDMKK